VARIIGWLATDDAAVAVPRWWRLLRPLPPIAGIKQGGNRS